MIFNEETPIERYKIRKRDIYVKREDLYSQEPSLSKLRGIYRLAKTLKANKIKVIGVMDTRVSKAGWGLAKIGKALYLDIICFYPKLKSDKKLPFIQQQEKKLGAKVVGLKAGRIAILYNQAKKYTFKKKGFMLPMGLILQETVEETAFLMRKIPKHFKSIVVCTGTGTILAGIIKGCETLNYKPKIYGVSCGMSITKQKKVIRGLLNFDIPENVTLIDAGFDYYEKIDFETPFPSSPYYDKKAWWWLITNLKRVEYPVLFWNIGV